MIKKILYGILGILFFLFLVLIYARFIGTSGLKTNEIVYKNKNIPDLYQGMKVVHFSDLHYKKVITKKRVKELIKEIKKINPDLVLFTGDLLDSDYNINSKDVKFLIEELSQIEAKYGKFAILGDNDYLKTDTVKNIYIQSDFTLLENDYSIIHNENNEQIFIGGVSTYNYEEADIDKVMANLKSNGNVAVRIIMVHEGDYIKEIMEKYDNIDLILGGHSINGSINIWGLKYLLLPDGGKKYYKSHYHINNTDIFISNGVGVNEVNFRLFNRPSINFYRFSNGIN